MTHPSDRPDSPGRGADPRDAGAPPVAPAALPADPARPDPDPAEGPDLGPLEPDLRAAAAHYNGPPPEVPAEAMWAAIQARRARPQAPPVEQPPALVVTRRPRGGSPWRPAWRRSAAAAAAVALLGVGIGIGRHTAPGGPASGGLAVQGPAPVGATGGERQPVAVATGPDAPTAAEAPDRPTPTSDRPAAPAAGRAPGPAPARAATRTQVALASADRGRAAASPVASAVASPVMSPPADAPAGAGAAGASRAGAGASAGASAPLRALTEQHLARTEALLAAFAAPPGGPAATGPDAAWARDLLTTTRLLLDSPAGREPTRRALLEELELVLGQIARLPRADTADERALIDRAIRRGDLMARLRTAAPAGAPAAGFGT